MTPAAKTTCAKAAAARAIAGRSWVEARDTKYEAQLNLRD